MNDELFFYSIPRRGKQPVGSCRAEIKEEEEKEKMGGILKTAAVRKVCSVDGPYLSFSPVLQLITGGWKHLRLVVLTVAFADRLLMFGTVK